MAALSYPSKGIARRLTARARARDLRCKRLAGACRRWVDPLVAPASPGGASTSPQLIPSRSSTTGSPQCQSASVSSPGRATLFRAPPSLLSEEFRRGSGPARSCAGSASDGLRARAPRRAAAVRGRGTGGVEVAANHSRRCSGTDSIGWSRPAPVPLDEEAAAAVWRDRSTGPCFRGSLARLAGTGLKQEAPRIPLGGWFVRKVQKPAPWPLRL
jgi:hypothetical protein